jgi:hypothetical protein
MIQMTSVAYLDFDILLMLLLDSLTIKHCIVGSN